MVVFTSVQRRRFVKDLRRSSVVGLGFCVVLCKVRHQRQDSCRLSRALAEVFPCQLQRLFKSVLGLISIHAIGALEQRAAQQKREQVGAAAAVDRLDGKNRFKQRCSPLPVGIAEDVQP